MTDKESVMQALKDSLRNQHCGFIENVGNVYAVSEETINDTLELLKEQPKWISVEDQMPPENMRVIGYNPVDGCMFVGFRKTYRYSWQDTSVCYWYILTARCSTKQITKRVTHWMPLPEPPERTDMG